MTIIISGSTGVSGVDGSAGTPSLQGGDANTGFFYGTDILGFSTGGSERMRIDASGNLGLGVTPVTGWNSSAKVLQFSNGTIWNNGGTTVLGSNVSFNSSYSPYYIGTNLAGAFVYNYTGSGGFQWLQAPSGTAGNAITFTQAMTLDASGNLGIGTSSPSYKLHVSGGNAAVVNSGGVNLYVGQGLSGADYGYINVPSDKSKLVIGADSTLPMTFVTNGSERMRIDSSGNVGIGTSSPDARLVATTSSGDCQIIARANGTNGGGIFVADGGGAGSYPGLALKQSGVHYWSVQQRADTNLYLHRESGSGNTIVDSGALLVGTTTAFARISSKISSNSQIAVWTSGLSGDLTTAGIRVDKFDNNSTTSQKFIEFSVNNNTTANGQINANGASQAAFGNWSDVRLKENIKDLSGQLEKICSLRPVEFDYKSGGHQIGFIAQEIQNVFPDSVSDDGTEQKYLSVTGWNKTEARLVKAIQELNEKVEQQAAEIAALKGAA